MSAAAASDRLPRLLDQRALAAELGVPANTALNLMRKLPKVNVGRRVFVTDDAVRDYLRNSATT